MTTLPAADLTAGWAQVRRGTGLRSNSTVSPAPHTRRIQASRRGPYKGKVYEYVRLRWRSVRDPSGGVVAPRQMH